MNQDANTKLDIHAIVERESLEAKQLTRLEGSPLLTLLPYQLAALRTSARFTWNCWSRQTGKSFTFSLRRVLRGLARRRNQIILSAGERQSREVMEKVRMHCEALRVACELFNLTLFEGMRVNGLEARLPLGVRIIALPANPMTARGFTGDVFLDEFAMHADDEAVWAALFPTVLRGEGEIDIASTPRGRKNLFHRLQSNSMFAASTVTLKSAVEEGLDVDPLTLQAAVGDDEIWRQEFCCEFLDETTSFLPYELIRSCQDGRLSADVDWAMLEERFNDLFVGVDVGRKRDLTAIWLWQREGEAMITRGLVVMAGAPFTEQEAMLARILSGVAIRRCCIDATGMGLHLAERLVERFGDHLVEGVVMTCAVKSEAAGAVRMMAERGLLRIPADEAISQDWHSIARSVTSAGHIRYDADRSSVGHGDRFWAAALGLYAAKSAMTGGAGLITGEVLRFSRKGIW